MPTRRPRTWRTPGTLVDGAFGELRSMIFELRPAVLDADGLAETVRKHLEVVGRVHGLTATVAADCRRRLPAEIEAPLFRIVQEAVGNVVRHAQATTVRIELREADGMLTVAVIDDGIGFDPSIRGPRGRHLGLDVDARAGGGAGRAAGRSTRHRAPEPRCGWRCRLADAPIRVLVVDDHPVVRQGLRAFLSSRPGIVVAGEAEDGDAAVAVAAELDPDIVLIDLVMPGAGGVEAIRRLRATGDRPRVIVLTSFSGDDHVVAAVRAGAAGYLLKDVAPSELEAAIRTVHHGGALLDPHVVGTVMAEVARGGPAPGLDDLTPRELDVLRLLAQGLSNRDLATTLFVSEKTVKTHVSSILTKLHLADRTQAALFAVRHGISPPNQRFGGEES